MKHKGPNTGMVDLEGPDHDSGFVDADGHIVVGGLQALSADVLAPPDGKVRDIASLQQTLRDWVRANAARSRKTKVIIGFGYDNAQLEELRHPTTEELDAVSQDIPVMVVHQSGHLGAINANAAMLKAMGVDARHQGPAAASSSASPAPQSPTARWRRPHCFAADPGSARPRRTGRTEGLRARRREALGALRLHHGRGRPGQRRRSPTC